MLFRKPTQEDPKPLKLNRWRTETRHYWGVHAHVSIIQPILKHPDGTEEMLGPEMIDEVHWAYVMHPDGWWEKTSWSCE